MVCGKEAYSTGEIIATSANQIVLPKLCRPTKMLYYIHHADPAPFPLAVLKGGLGTRLEEYEFNSHPECIYDMDETGVPLEPRPPKVIAKRGQKKDPIPNFWAESTDNSHWMWQCNRSNNPPFYHLCC